MDNFKDELEKLKKAIDEAVEKSIKELERLREEVSSHPEWLFRRKFYRLYDKLEYIVEDLEDSIEEALETLRDLKRKARERGDEALLESIKQLEDHVRSKLREFSEKYKELIKHIEEIEPKLRIRRRPRWVALTLLPARLAVSIGAELEETIKEVLEEVGKEVRRALESATTVVSSIRLKEDDAKVIDELVEAGIFKSRSEAVAYFTHKGIEASKEWLEKVREQIKKIRELREEIKKEFEKEEK